MIAFDKIDIIKVRVYGWLISSVRYGRNLVWSIGNFFTSDKDVFYTSDGDSFNSKE